MRRWRLLLRAAVLWLVASALPLQGVAAATMLACGPLQATPPHAMPHAVAAEHVHAHENAADDTTVASPKCSACALCCTAGLPPAPAAAVHSGARADVVVPMAAADAALFLTDGPERPPRPFLD